MVQICQLRYPANTGGVSAQPDPTVRAEIAPTSDGPVRVFEADPASSVTDLGLEPSWQTAQTNQKTESVVSRAQFFVSSDRVPLVSSDRSPRIEGPRFGAQLRIYRFWRAEPLLRRLQEHPSALAQRLRSKDHKIIAIARRRQPNPQPFPEEG